jgi:histidyl-tRNA synthetase
MKAGDEEPSRTRGPEEERFPTRVDVVVCVVGKDVESYVLEVLMALRQIHVRCGAVRMTESPIARCLVRGIGHCAFIGVSDKERRVITIKRLCDKEQRSIPISARHELEAFIRRTPPTTGWGADAVPNERPSANQVKTE